MKSQRINCTYIKYFVVCHLYACACMCSVCPCVYIRVKGKEA